MADHGKRLPCRGDPRIDDCVEGRDVEAGMLLPTLDDDHRVVPDAVAQGNKKAADRGRVKDVDSQSRAVSTKEIVNPVRYDLELEGEVIRQGLGCLVAPQALTDPHLLECQLAMLAVIEDGRRVRDDLDRNRLHRRGR